MLLPVTRDKETHANNTKVMFAPLFHDETTSFLMQKYWNTFHAQGHVNYHVNRRAILLKISQMCKSLAFG